ncbi:MAG: hypothetical protein HKM93_18455 [Desulfobacteraceae bacterium]|nr:hypothetical protein [Desulfobacteraceae bacterium]
MNNSDPKIGKIFLGFAAICVLALPFIVISAISKEPKKPGTVLEDTQAAGFDQNGDDLYLTYDRISQVYLEGTSTGRTLEEYYSRREYAGSPPFIPHPVEEAEKPRLDCLTCHAKGGWTEELKRNTPLTPHPDQTACLQCHVPVTTEILFIGSNWASSPPPSLGRAHLPGAPPPIPHDLQMRGDCIACHVGPGAVNAIRVEHPMRGNCRQCHVPDGNPATFHRNSEY